MAAKDLRGQKFGRLTPISSFWDQRMQCTRWICQCDCGETAKVRAYFLTRGGTRSCGCLRAENNTSPARRKEISAQVKKRWSEIRSGS